MDDDVLKRIGVLSKFITDEKKARIEKVLSLRTNYLTFVLEDIFQSQNASATIRTGEILGLSDVHVIEKKNKHTLNPDVTLGSSQWINLNKYRNAKFAIDRLKSDGYSIVATSLNPKSINLENLTINNKMAIFFGTELTGLSAEVLGAADLYVKIPMYGFTQSYNISVAVAIVMYSLLMRLRKSSIDYLLNEAEKSNLRLKYYRQVVKNYQFIENLINS
ncbi:tRNA/rRNA methyltransferase [Borreliella burgdorferi 29805]|uniref:TrmH family RNA methyltransferase n=1 Tax=Borreliella burgdorferi TaxID=139 RepID=UPI00017F3C27|nr:RNA methyltransferase [Borreliella burgdorferi]EEH32556.1 tRNA/rRNA methyltransferase [Borreliella burgdorferi 29805]MCD2309126.1 RNA methyltransferase [Borreliella burgdorferi]MCD2318384.1 RNA methyltransferase [Borreliella burgdorferi]MCD2319386.1 RNA methyltransferase [Borreliella burgdorferi]MCD2372669.1 RNA methyltransferase [Borreliella burgdorferi]